MFKKVTIIIFLLSNLSAIAKPVKIAASLSVEPYIIKTTNKGFEIDIVREILLNKGFEPLFIYEPLRRTKKSFLLGDVDAVMTIKKHYPEIKGSFISDPYIKYHNCVVSLKENNFIINKVEDMKNFNIIAFQQAKIAFNDAFYKLTANNEKYKEMYNQLGQIQMLFLKRTDVIVLDYYIFMYYKTKVIPKQILKDVSIHNIFNTSEFHIAFRDKKIKDAFNHGLKEIKKSGRYQKIIDSYNLPRINLSKIHSR